MKKKGKIKKIRQQPPSNLSRDERRRNKKKTNTTVNIEHQKNKKMREQKGPSEKKTQCKLNKRLTNREKSKKRVALTSPTTDRTPTEEIRLLLSCY